MYNVRRVLDSNTIQLDERTRKPTWPADVSGITLRLHDAGNTQPLGNTYLVAQAPATSSCNVQIYVTIDDSNFGKADFMDISFGYTFLIK